MSDNNFSAQDAEQQPPHSGHVIESRGELSLFDAVSGSLVGGVVGFCASKFGFDQELPENLMIGGITAFASGVAVGALSYICRR